MYPWSRELREDDYDGLSECYLLLELSERCLLLELLLLELLRPELELLFLLFLC